MIMDYLTKGKIEFKDNGSLIISDCMLFFHNNSDGHCISITGADEFSMQTMTINFTCNSLENRFAIFKAKLAEAKFNFQNRYR